MTIGVAEFFNIVVLQLKFHAVIFVIALIRYSYFLYKQNQKLKKEHAYTQTIYEECPIFGASVNVPNKS